MKRARHALVVVVLAAGAGCDRRDVDGPPDVRLGRDECAECGMGIHEERSSAALVIERDGRREHLLFDDIGCLLDIERSGAADFSVVGRYVHDHSTSAWAPAENAAFLLTDRSRMRTPMGSGIAAFSDRAGAESARLEFGGDVLDYRGLAARRREQMEVRP